MPSLWVHRAPAKAAWALHSAAALQVLLWASWLEKFWSDAARALSLIGRGWLLASVNAGAKC